MIILRRFRYALHLLKHFLVPEGLDARTCSRCGYPWHQREWFESAHWNPETKQWEHYGYVGPWTV
jgi:hypothetical protein